MANKIQITVDASGPRALGAFWCEVLGYIEQPPPPGFETWETAKNRLHLDVHTEPEKMQARAAELVALGATRVGEFDEPEGYWITMLDPEGNEFCLH